LKAAVCQSHNDEPQRDRKPTRRSEADENVEVADFLSVKVLLSTEDATRRECSIVEMEWMKRSEADENVEVADFLSVKVLLSTEDATRRECSIVEMEWMKRSEADENVLKERSRTRGCGQIENPVLAGRAAPWSLFSVKKTV
jgi:hypothetical protein